MNISKIIQEEIKLFLEKRPRIGSVDKVNYNDQSFNTKITSDHLNSLERELDDLFSGAGIDIEFTKHFLDRVNDPRNKKDITIEELRTIFKEVYSKYKDDIINSGSSFEAVIKSLSTDINIPFALEWDEKNQELDLVSKTVMRKKGFKTTNPILSVKENSKQYPVAMPPEYGDSDYKARGGKVFLVSPKKFLSLVPELNIEDDDSKDNIEDLKNMMEKGVQLDPPTLYLNNNQVVDHDGRHRAYAAIELGINKIPVLVIDQNNETITTFPINELDNLKEEYPKSFNKEEFKKLNSFSARVKYCEEHLQRISSGSSRIAYKIDEEKVLKLAKNKKGIAQNEVENKYGNYYDIKHIIANTFDADEQNLWIEMEFAKKVSKSIFEKVTELTLEEFSAVMTNHYTETVMNKAPTINVSPELKEQVWENEFGYDMLDFMMGYKKPVGDLIKLSSYGLVSRDGLDQIVLIDFGLSSAVYDSYYS